MIKLNFIRFVYNIRANASFNITDREDTVFYDAVTNLDNDIEKRELESLWETKFQFQNQKNETLSSIEEELLYGAHYVIVYVDHEKVSQSHWHLNLVLSILVSEWIMDCP